MVLQFSVVSNDDALSQRVVLGAASSTHHLKHVLRTQLDPAALLGRVNLGSLYDDRVSRKVDSPSQSRS